MTVFQQKLAGGGFMNDTTVDSKLGTCSLDLTKVLKSVCLKPSLP